MADDAGEVMEIKLRSRDGQVYDVPTPVATMSITLKNMIDEGFGGDTAIPIQDVDGAILKRVIEYCQYRKNHPYTPEQTKDEKSLDLDDWDEQFVDVDQATLFEMILAANYLDIKPLLDLTCKKVAKMIKQCKNADEIRQKFNIECDFSPEELEAVKKENEWCEER